MLRRLRLPGKLTVAVLPLLLILASVSGVLVVTTLEDAAQSRETAALAGSWAELNAAVEAVTAEQGATLAALSAEEPVDVEAARSATDAALEELEATVRSAGSPTSLLRQLDLAGEALVATRAFHDESGTSADAQLRQLPEGFEQVQERLPPDR